MLQMNSPGVYQEERDLSAYVDDSSSCVVGVVGAARKGPVGVPTLVTNQEQLVRVFGEPIEGEYGVYSALQALTRVSQLYYTRVVRSGRAARAGVYGTDKLVFRSKTVGVDSNGISVKISDYLPTAGTLKIEVLDKAVGDEEPEVLETFAGLSVNSNSENYVERVIAEQSNYVIAELQSTGNIANKTLVLGAEQGSEGMDSGKYARAGVAGTDKLTFTSKNFDSTLNGSTIVLGEIDQFGYFSISLYDSEGNLLESFSNLSLDPSSDRFVENIIESDSQSISCVMNLDDNIQYQVKTMVMYGGDDGVSGISSHDMIGETNGTGIYSFSNPDVIAVDVLITPGWSDRALIAAATTMCETRGDVFYVIDPPFGMNVQGVLNWTNGTGVYSNQASLDSSYSAVYWPWVKVADSYTGKNIWLPPSGFVTAQYAYTDDVAFPWNAPAGLSRGKITRAIAVEMSPTQGERDALYGNRNVVNPIVNFTANGIVIWGQKTTQRAPTALDRVNVRRLMIYLKRKIGISTRSFVFEQNIESTWERWKTIVEPVLRNCQVNGGLYEYKIVAKASDVDIENNRMPIKVYVKPTKTAEFISLTFNVMPYSASFDNL